MVKTVKGLQLAARAAGALGPLRLTKSTLWPEVVIGTMVLNHIFLAHGFSMVLKTRYFFLMVPPGFQNRLRNRILFSHAWFLHGFENRIFFSHGFSLVLKTGYFFLMVLETTKKHTNHVFVYHLYAVIRTRL
jgi:hypothetical protein